MFYETPEDWRRARHRRVALFGMSGLGKTRIAAMLRERGATGSTTRSISASAPATWASTSSTTSSARRCATPSCASCCARTRSTSPRTSPSTTSSRSRPTSASPATRPRAASPSTNTSAASASTAAPRSPPPATPLPFIDKAEEIYGYDHFVCRHLGLALRGGRPRRPGRPGAGRPRRARRCRSGSAAPRPTSRSSARRFDQAPKPMYYPEGFLTELWDGLPRRPRASPPTRSTPTPSSATASAR